MLPLWFNPRLYLYRGAVAGNIGREIRHCQLTQQDDCHCFLTHYHSSNRIARNGLRRSWARPTSTSWIAPIEVHQFGQWLDFHHGCGSSRSPHSWSGYIGTLRRSDAYLGATQVYVKPYSASSPTVVHAPPSTTLNKFYVSDQSIYRAEDSFSPHYLACRWHGFLNGHIQRGRGRLRGQ